MATPKSLSIKPKVDLSTSVLHSSDQDQDPNDLTTSSQVESETEETASDLIDDITTLAIEYCGPCQEKATKQVYEAKWFCHKCEDLLCNDCMSYHKTFKTTKGHKLSSLHPPCDNCKGKSKAESNFFCNDCDDFLCDNCKSFHKLLRITENHHIVHSQDKITNQRNRIVPHHGTPAPMAGSKNIPTQIQKEDISQGNKSNPEISVLASTEGSQDEAAGQYQAKKEKRRIKREEISTTKDRNRKKMGVKNTLAVSQTSAKSMEFKTQPKINSVQNVQEPAPVRKQSTHDHKSKAHSILAATKTATTTKEAASVWVPFSKRTAKFVTQFDTKVPGDTKVPWITGSAFLPDSRLLLVDMQNKKLKLFDVNYKFVTYKQFSGGMYEVSVFDSSEVAVIAGHSDIVRLSIDGDVIKEKGKISPGFECWGVSYINKDKLAVTGVDKGWFGRNDDIMCVYTTTGKQLSRFSLQQGGKTPCHVTADEGNSRAYVSTMATGTVSAIDLTTNEIVFTYKHKDLSWPEGIAVDKNHNFYVCDELFKHIHRVSPTGKYIQTMLLKNSLQVGPPRTMSFTPNGDTFIVGGSFHRLYSPPFVQVYKRV